MGSPCYWRSWGENRKEKIIIMDQHILPYIEDIRKIRMHWPQKSLTSALLEVVNHPSENKKFIGKGLLGVYLLSYQLMCANSDLLTVSFIIC